MLKSMKIRERGQVTIPKEIRERFGLNQATEVQFPVEKDLVVLQKTPAKLKLDKWKGRCKRSFAKLGHRSVDDFIEDVRGR